MVAQNCRIFFCILIFAVCTTPRAIAEPSKNKPLNLEPPSNSSLLFLPEDTAEKLYPKEMGEDLSELVLKLSNRLDSFFGDDHADDIPNGSTLRVVPSYVFYDGSEGAFELGINLNLKLRNLEAKAKELETSIREGLIPKELLNPNLHLNQTPAEAAAAKAKEESAAWHYNLESKLVARPAIYYSGKIRVRRGFDDGIFLHQLAISFGWDTDDKWNQRTSFYTDRAISEKILFRFANDGDWFISRQKFQTSHGPSLMQTINKYNSVSYNMRYIMGVFESFYQHLESNINIHFRHETPSKKIAISLIPGLTYPMVTHFTEIRSLQVRFEYLFGDIR